MADRDTHCFCRRQTRGVVFERVLLATTMVVANNTRLKTTPRVLRWQKQCVSLSSKGSSRRCKVASARGTRNYHSPAEEILRALAPEYGTSHCITPQQHPGGHFSRPGDLEHPSILFSSPEFPRSHSSRSDGTRHISPTLAGKAVSIVLNPGGGDPPTVTTFKEGYGASVAGDGDALAAAEEPPPDPRGESAPQNEPQGGPKFRDYPPQPPEDSYLQ